MIRTIAQAARYIDRVGFCLLFPSKKLPLPSLIEASKGRALRNYKPCADWSDDFVRLWRWKDELPRKRLAYYGKYFRGRGVFLSLEFLAYFYCLEGNHGTRDEYERLYREGKITADAHVVCTALVERGPQATLELRYGLGWEAKRGNRRFKRALLELQQRLLIVHWGTKAETRAWESAVYQLTARAFPKAMRAAAKLSPDVARQRIAAQYRKHRAHAKPQEVARLFGWSRAEAQAALDS
ncbi:MAG: hypothetical protein IH916_09795 [Acidobacteria bacterium]|nr:hypothetical protein [Acidobacteriota bacterium]